MNEVMTADLWAEARYHTAQMVETEASDSDLMFALTAADRSGCAIAVDLNLYRPGVNLKALLDRGVNRFILRMGGPRSWVEGAWNYQEDPTWRPYMTELDRLGVDVGRQVIGYHIHNPFEDWHAAMDYDVHIQLINEWTSGGFMPGAFMTDHEVATCWRGGTKITATPYNLVKSLESVTDKIWKKWRRTSAIYTARWFINTYGLAEHITYLDNVNKPKSLGGEGMQRPMWYAWVPQPDLGKVVYERAVDCANALLIPSGAQTAALLNCGSHSIYNLWQYLFSFRTPEMVAANQSGVDISVSRGTLAEFDAAFGLSASTPPPPDPDPEPTEEYVTMTQFMALVRRFEEHRHSTTTPI